jgi:hypothetical protein
MSAPDSVPVWATSATDAAGRFFAVTPSDSASLPNKPRALYVGTAGNLAIRNTTDGVTVTLVGVPAGSLLPVRPDRVMATGTTASNIVALY